MDSVASHHGAVTPFPRAAVWRGAPAVGDDDPAVSSRDERYSLRHVEQSLGLSHAVIDGLVEAGFVTPSGGPGKQRRFSFQDLMLLRTAHELRQAKVTPRRIVEALTTLRAALPDGAALTGVRVSALGSRVIVRDRQGAREAASGQFVIDFDAGHAPDVAGKTASAIEAVAATGEAPSTPTTPLPLPLPPPRRAGNVLVLARADARRSADDEAAQAPVDSAPSPRPLHDATGAYERGVAVEALDPAAAEAAYRRALELEPAHLQAAINLTALLCDQGRAAQADAVCIALLAHDGVDNALLRFNHALALDDLGRPRGALAAYRRAIELDPGFADAHYNAAVLLESLHDARGALRHFAAYRKLQGV